LTRATTVAWLRVDTQTILTIANHVITKNHRIGVTHTERKTWHLHIRDVSESDRGAYMCQINTDPMKSQTGYLDVVVPPDILDYMTSTDMIVREGSNVTLRCAAKGSPTPNITWRREDGDTIVLGNGEDGKRRVIKNKTATLYDVFLRLKKITPGRWERGKRKSYKRRLLSSFDSKHSEIEGLRTTDNN
ncbi:hypothetical protein E2986_11131, partial [Frieseomelitta varia]